VRHGANPSTCIPFLLNENLLQPSRFFKPWRTANKLFTSIVNVTTSRGSVASRALDPRAPFALAAIFLGAGFLLRSIWIDLDFAAFEFGAAEIDRRVDRVFDFDHFHEAEAPGTAGDFIGYHQGAADAAYFGEKRAKIIARN